MAASPMAARECMLTWIECQIEDIVCEVRVDEVKAEIKLLAFGILTFKVPFPLAIRLLSGVKPSKSAGTSKSKVGMGRFGMVTGPFAEIDIPKGLEYIW